MLHFQYFFTKIKTQTFSLILFGAFQEKKFLKDNSHVSYEDFLFIAVQKDPFADDARFRRDLGSAESIF